MFELPEIINFCRQMNATLAGKTIFRGLLGNMPHKFVWYNRTPEEFQALTAGRVFGTARPRGRWLLAELNPGYVLVLGECGGKLLYHPPGSPPPPKYHLLIHFDDGSALSVTTQMWGAMELYERGREEERQYIRGMRPTPIDTSFTLEYFNNLIDGLLQGEKRSCKSLLTQDQLIPGLGNSIAQDILFRSGLHPRRPLAELDSSQRCNLYGMIKDTVSEVVRQGGRNDELDLFGRPGGYERIMDSRAAGRPCPVCSTTVQKMAYLGGSCYFCPQCQPEK